MAYYLGMDVSQKATALCVVDGKGLIVAEGKALWKISFQKEADASKVQSKLYEKQAYWIGPCKYRCGS